MRKHNGSYFAFHYDWHDFLDCYETHYFEEIAAMELPKHHDIGFVNANGDLMCTLDCNGHVWIYDSLEKCCSKFNVYVFPEIYIYDNEDNIDGIDYGLLIMRVFREVQGYWKGQLNMARYMVDMLHDALHEEKTDDADNCKQ